MIMDREKLHNFQVAMEPMIAQPLEGLLYDLDLMPEQLNTEINGKRYSAIVNLYKKLEAQNLCNQWKMGGGKNN